MASSYPDLVRRLPSLVALIAILAIPSVAEARVTNEYGYEWTQVWQATVRLVRVDLGFPVSDRDDAIGYLLFEYRGGSRTYPGSVELVRVTAEDGSERVRVAVQVPSMPSYIERMIVDRLTRKLREDFGDPPRVRRRPAAPEPPAEEPGEGGDDDDEGDDDAS